MAEFLFIGNSHLAALKVAFDASEGVLPADTLMFGARGGSLSALERSGTKLTSEDPTVQRGLEISGGEPFIELSGHKRFVLVGLGLGPTLFLSAAIEDAAGRFISSSLRHKMEVVAFERYVLRIAQMIRSAVPDASIALVGEPLPAEDELGKNSPQGRVFQAATELGIGREPIDAYEIAIEKVAAEVCDATFLRQNEETKVDGFLTKPEFARDGLNWAKAEQGSVGARDHRHMNAEFGALTLANVVDWAQM